MPDSAQSSSSTPYRHTAPQQPRALTPCTQPTPPQPPAAKGAPAAMPDAEMVQQIDCWLMHRQPRLALELLQEWTCCPPMRDHLGLQLRRQTAAMMHLHLLDAQQQCGSLQLLPDPHAGWLRPHLEGERLGCYATTVAAGLICLRLARSPANYRLLEMHFGAAAAQACLTSVEVGLQAAQIEMQRFLRHFARANLQPFVAALIGRRTARGNLTGIAELSRFHQLACLDPYSPVFCRLGAPFTQEIARRGEAPVRAWQRWVAAESSRWVHAGRLGPVSTTTDKHP